MAKITSLTAREIIDSRGNPTIEVSCLLSDGSMGTVSIPSGASTGIHEAHELRDKDPKRFNGKGVLTAVASVEEEIAKNFIGHDYTQESLDKALCDLDGTENKSRLGANAILGVSLAFAKACALSLGKELYEYVGLLSGEKEFHIPIPSFNIINGGKHADSGLDIQEFMMIPIGIIGIDAQIRAASEIINSLRIILHRDGYSVGVGDEGGFAPAFSSNELAIEYIIKAILDAGYTTSQCKIALDVAASSFYKDGVYNLSKKENSQQFTQNELLGWYSELIEKYPIISIEDGFAEEDWEGFAKMKQLFGEKIHIVGDDLLTTNIVRIKLAHEYDAVNTVLIKPNQIGTLSETIEAIKLTRFYRWETFASHRSGETTDTFIADLAVGLSCRFLKAGSLTRGERVCKYDRLLEINEHITKVHNH